MCNSEVSPKFINNFIGFLASSSLSAIFASLGLPFLLLWKKAGGFSYLALLHTLYNCTFLQCQAKRTEREKHICPTLLRPLLALLSEFQVHMSTKCCCDFHPCRITWDGGIREKIKRTGAFPLLFLRVGSPLSCSSSQKWKDFLRSLSRPSAHFQVLGSLEFSVGDTRGQTGNCCQFDGT